MTIEKQPDGFLIDNRFRYSSNPKIGYVTISPTCGEDVIYDKNQKNFINYQGEYEFDHFAINSIQTNGKLSFFISPLDLDDSFAVISDIGAFENEDFVHGAKSRILSDRSFEEQMTKLELEGRVYFLE